MFDRSTEYPCAVTSGDADGLEDGIQWCLRLLAPGDILTVWVPLKSSLRHNARLQRLVNHSNVELMTGRGMQFVHGRGPVLAAWPRMEDIGEIQRSSNHVTGLCVVAWNEEEIRPWVRAIKPEILGDPEPWDEDDEPDLDPVIIEAMKGLSLTINHNNTIAAGFEKDQVVSVLLALHDHGYRLDGHGMQGWALANGWSGKNPQHLAKYANTISDGKRPKARQVLRSDYIARMQSRAAGQSDA